jgi:peptidoglycan/xylan/chitin deacetylase (PgdA/CDA1 family)
LADKALAAELHNSEKQLKAWTGAAITGFCYPNGDYTPRVEQAVAKAGYRYACTVEEGINRHGVCLTRLVRLPITMQRTMRGPHHDRLGFRAELSRLRMLWR